LQHLQSAGILGVGMAVPDRVLTNAELERMVDTTDQWIVERTGIRERRIAGPEDTAGSLGIRAARQALDSAGVRADEIDLIVCATVTGDYPWPATACVIQDGLKATRAAAFDISAACCGFVYGLETAASFVRAGSVTRALVVGSDVLSKSLDWTDRATCILFGDGACAAVVGPCASGEGILATSMGSDGSGLDCILQRVGGSRHPLTPEAMARNENKIEMRGHDVYRFAVRIMGQTCLEALDKAGLTSADVDLFIPHQANIRIINAAAQRMGLPPEKVFVNVDRYGNTSAASIGIAMVEAIETGRLKRGDLIVTVGFGAGLTWGANVIRWSRD